MCSSCLERTLCKSRILCNRGPILKFRQCPFKTLLPARPMKGPEHEVWTNTGQRGAGGDRGHRYLRHWSTGEGVKGGTACSSSTGDGGSRGGDRRALFPQTRRVFPSLTCGFHLQENSEKQFDKMLLVTCTFTYVCRVSFMMIYDYGETNKQQKKSNIVVHY